MVVIKVRTRMNRDMSSSVDAKVAATSAAPADMRFAGEQDESIAADLIYIEGIIKDILRVQRIVATGRAVPITAEWSVSRKFCEDSG
jgi:hypothetical protein